MDKYLPIGSVVLLDGGSKRLMIYGQMQKESESGRTWDYVGCPYPEGHLGKHFIFLFNHAQIERLFCVGFQDGEGIAFSEALSTVSEDTATGTVGSTDATHA